MKFLAEFATYLARTQEAGPKPVDKMLTELGGSVGGLVEKVATGQGGADIAMAAVSFAVLLAIGLILLTKRSSAPVGGLEDIVERLERIEIAMREGAQNAKFNAEVKGVVGYFKQELSDIRNSVFALQQQSSAMEGTINQIDYRLSDKATAPKPRVQVNRKPDANFLAAQRGGGR